MNDNQKKWAEIFGWYGCTYLGCIEKHIWFNENKTGSTLVVNALDFLNDPAGEIKHHLRKHFANWGMDEELTGNPMAEVNEYVKYVKS